MLISIVVLNYNGKNCLKMCLNSILKLNFPKSKYEVIVVDNASIDGSWKLVKKYGFKLIRTKKNVGFAEGNNIGIRKAKGDYVSLISNDVLVDKNWLKELMPIIKSNEKIGIIGGKIYYRKTPKIWFGGAKVYFGAFVNHKYLNNKAGKSDYIAGAAIIFRKSALDKAGLFDKKFYLYAEDIDLCQRISRVGYKIFYWPKAISYHMIEDQRASSHQEYYEQRNRVYLCSKKYNYTKSLFILVDFFILFPLFWFNRIIKNPKKIKFWKETLRARVDSIKLIMSK